MSEPEEPMIERRTITVPRSWAVSVVIGLGFMVGSLIMVGLAMFRQGEDVAELVQAQRRADKRADEAARQNTAAARERVSGALEGVRTILEESIADHDKTAVDYHNEQLRRLAEIVNRPMPTPIALPTRPVNLPPASPAPRAGDSPPPPSAPPSPSYYHEPHKGGRNLWWLHPRPPDGVPKNNQACGSCHSKNYEEKRQR